VHGSLRVAIRLTPRARAERILAVTATSVGRALKASVTAPTHEGRATEAMLPLLARSWRLPRRDFTNIAGFTSRGKTVRIRLRAAAADRKTNFEPASSPGQ